MHVTYLFLSQIVAGSGYNGIETPYHTPFKNDVVLK